MGGSAQKNAPTWLEAAREVAADGSGEESRLFRQVLGCFGTGVTVITSTLGAEVRGMTASAFMSGSLNPPLVVASVGQKTRMHGMLTASGLMGISILSAAQESCSRRFAGQATDSSGAPPLELLGEVPVVSGALAVLTTQICARHPCGDHTLFVGRVRHLGYADLHEPLLHYRGQYERLVGRVKQLEPVGQREPEEWTVGW